MVAQGLDSKQTTGEQAGTRVRLVGAQRVPVAGKGCRVRVRLESLPRGAYQGVGEGPASLDGELRAAAEATLDAIRALLGFSPLGDDPAQATALAVLSATNRLLAIRPGP